MLKWLLTLVIALLLLGVLSPWLRRFGFGRLPGDIVVDRPGLRFFFPITTMIVVSLLVSLLLWLFRR